MYPELICGDCWARAIVAQPDKTIAANRKRHGIVIIVVLIRFTLFSEQEEPWERRHPCLLASISESSPEIRRQGRLRSRRFRSVSIGREYNRSHSISETHVFIEP